MTEENTKITEVLMDFREQVIALEKEREEREIARRNRVDLLKALKDEIESAIEKKTFSRIFIGSALGNTCSLTINLEEIAAREINYEECLCWTDAKKKSQDNGHFSKILNKILAGEMKIEAQQ